MSTTESAAETLYKPHANTAQPNDAKEQAASTNATPATGIPIPKDGKWAPEALKALGVPEKPEGYALERPSLPDGMPYDEAFEAEMRGAAHELGVAPWQLQGLLNRYADYAGRQFGDIGKLGEEARGNAEAELKRDWGRDYDAKLSFARRTVSAYGGESAVAALESSGLGNHSVLIKMLATIGEAMGEDSLVQGDRGGGQVKRDAATILYGS